MKFEEVFVELKNGKRIRRAAWEKKVFIYLKETDFIRCNDDDEYEGSLYYIYNKDLFLEDWEIYKEIPRLKPCPCCGDDADISDIDDINCSIYCKNLLCGISMQPRNYLQNPLIDRWNRRV